MLRTPTNAQARRHKIAVALAHAPGGRQHPNIIFTALVPQGWFPFNPMRPAVISTTLLGAGARGWCVAAELRSHWPRALVRHTDRRTR